MTSAALDPRLTAVRRDLADIRLRGAVAAERFVEGAPMRVVAPSVGLWSRPDAASPRAATLLMGEPVTVFERAEGWAWAQSAVDGYVGYAPADAFAAGWLDHARTATVAALRTHLYSAPDLKTAPAAWAPLGARLAAEDRVENGFRALSGGVWAFDKHLAPAPAADWVAVAEAFLGAPYLWGGKTADGLDCSGLVQIALQASGRACPRDSDMQEAALGDALPADAPLRRGDLIFWRGHVGVMVDAETLLHATAFAMAVIREPLVGAAARIEAAGAGAATSRRRI